MALKKKPVTGMRDILPAEMQVREYVMNQIRDTYQGFGFTQIETPCVEHIENLTSKQGGDNEKLIFKILKRGEKLDLKAAQNEGDLVDGGLRYDLTLPLARYFSNNGAQLPMPFKALQMGSVWRADHPQKGRFRQFTQCDIDILGDETSMAEIELILATTAALGKICPENGFTVRVNDREILKGMAVYCGFEEGLLDQVFIILDKMDKIGIEGVKAELLEAGHARESVEKYVALLAGTGHDAAGVRKLGEVLESAMPKEVAGNLAYIMETVADVAETEFSLYFDPTLVRGMSYYTGTIFEVSMEGFGGSVAGGGRYDKMIGKFTGKDTPACGFSIGFERIITILMDQGGCAIGDKVKKAYLIEKGMDSVRFGEIMKQAMEERRNGVQVLVSHMNKNKKFQKGQLEKEGYTEFVNFYRESLK
ncbi:MAG: histidine--tRNA ligase [Lachnospiraceae bacterium]|nr:histidine--tRNA ligase [Lachnospiraceae bacterium]MCI9185704.1 histidine--tRNA ligase [Lachnospiraceae bacterium]